MLPSRKAKREGYLPLANSAQEVPSGPAGLIVGGPLPALGKRVSPSVDQRRQRPASTGGARIAAGQLVQPVRQKDKFVPLPDSTVTPEAGETQLGVPTTTIFEDIEDFPQAETRGRITVYCIAERLERKALEGVLKAKATPPVMHLYPDVVHLETAGDEGQKGDVFFFDYGVIVTWGLSQQQEHDVIQHMGRVAQQEPLDPAEVEIDRFQFHYSAHEPPHMQNDTITVNKRQATDHQVKLAISFALAQSTKLCVYEERVVEVVLETKHLPESLARHGTVHISSKKVAQLIGKVFLQRSAVNLLSTVLDTPEFFWSSPDKLQALYERACEYLELETRVDVLNARFQVLQEMLDMLRDHQNNFHTARLEWIIIWLIAVELVVGLFQLMGLFGLVGRE